MDAFKKVTDFLRDNDFAFRQSDLTDPDQNQIEILNADSGSHLRINFNRYEATLFFCDNHEHFDLSYDDEVYWLTQLIEDLLLNRRCAASLTMNKEDGGRQLLATSFASRKDVRNADYEKIFSEIMKLERLENIIGKNKCMIVLRFWDPSLDREIELPGHNSSFS